jgi:hypothetical protein
MAPFCRPGFEVADALNVAAWKRILASGESDTLPVKEFENLNDDQNEDYKEAIELHSGSDEGPGNPRRRPAGAGFRRQCKGRLCTEKTADALRLVFILYAEMLCALSHLFPRVLAGSSYAPALIILGARGRSRLPSIPGNPTNLEPYEPQILEMAKSWEAIP